MYRIILVPVVAAALACGCGSRRLEDYLEALGDCECTTDASAGTTLPPDTDPGDTEVVADTSTSGDSATSAEATTGADETTDETTADPGPVCGNGVLEPFGDEPEECDDGNLNPDDGCSDTCALDRRVFVTNKRYQGWELESPYIANAFCAKRAQEQGFAEPLTYRAWLSDSQTDARDQFVRGRGRLVMVDGVVFAQSWPALLAGDIDHPLEVTESGDIYHGGVWTGTMPDGRAVPGSQHCDDWATKSVLTTGHYGYSNQLTAEWTLALDSDQPAQCPADFSIYCFQTL